MRAVVFEEHSSVLPHWAGRGLRGATVVVLDAHLDLQHLDDERLQLLRRCTGPEALRTHEAPHPFAVAAGACFGIEDFLYPAARLGLLGRIVWVAPPHVLQQGFAAPLQRLVQMEGVTIDEIDALQLTPGGWVRGTLMGVDIEVCTLEQLPRMPLPPAWQLDIDVDYFVALPGDRLWIDPLEVVARLRQLEGAPEELTISRSVGSGFTPQALRDLADRMADVWQGGAVSLPAATGPALDATHGPAGDVLAGVLRDIAATHSRHLPLQQARLRQWHWALEQVPAGTDGARLGPAWVMLGLLHCAAGQPAPAAAAASAAAALGHPHPELALALGGLLAERGDPAAGGHAEQAIGHAATRVRGWALRARIAAHAGELAAAERDSAAVRQATPASPWAAQAHADALSALGHAEEAAAARADARRLMAQLRGAAERLAPFGRARALGS